MAKFLLILLCLIAAPPPAEARGPVTLDEAGLRAAYAGKTHVSAYRRNIEAYGGVYFEETYYADGALRYQAGGVVTAGRWEIADGAICFQYDYASLIPACFAVVYKNGCFFSYEIAADGTIIGLDDENWWIRSKIKGTNPDCAEEELMS